MQAVSRYSSSIPAAAIMTTEYNMLNFEDLHGELYNRKTI